MTDSKPLPRLQKAASGRWELIVDGKPYLILGAELQNSSMSSARYMDTVWQELKDMGINTILGAVAWEDIEPEENVFNFAELDTVIAGARRYGIRLGILWFGSYKNAKSSYAPIWVKKDWKRFPRMYVNGPDGRLKNSATLSVFSKECRDADAKAFTRLMQHLKDNDAERTVILVQVQNEVGLQGDSRDRSPVATALFKSSVPPELVSFLTEEWKPLHSEVTRNFPDFIRTAGLVRASDKASGSWEDYFGKSIWTNELFMTYHYSRYLDTLRLRAGQSTVFRCGEPGSYPSGGPASSVLDIWIKFAPHIDFLSPDIYHNSYSLTCADYRHKDGALFIPEQRRDVHGARSAWVAIGEHHALGVSPFGIDTQTAKEAAFTEHYRLLGSISSHILDARRRGLRIFGVCFHEVDEQEDTSPPSYEKESELYKLHITRGHTVGRQEPGYGLIIEMEPHKFMLVGKGFKVEFEAKAPGQSLTEILRFEEKSVVDPSTQELRTERTLNGDESYSGRWANMPVDDPDYRTCFVPVTIPARTGIATVEVYTITEEEEKC